MSPHLIRRVWSMPSFFLCRFRPRLRLPVVRQASCHRLPLYVHKRRFLCCSPPILQCPPVVFGRKWLLLFPLCGFLQLNVLLHASKTQLQHLCGFSPALLQFYALQLTPLR
ncbi:hypothetical protein GOODEAATRI_024914, partial [Goodea atripinnis]